MAVLILLLLGAGALLLAALRVDFVHVELLPLGLLFWIVAEAVDNWYARYARARP